MGSPVLVQVGQGNADRRGVEGRGFSESVPRPLLRVIAATHSCIS